MNIYTPQGFVDLRGLYKDPRLFIYICIASRQVGKTYNASDYVINDVGGKFLWMRRTDGEVETMRLRPDQNPFLEVNPNADIVKGDNKVLYNVVDSSEDPPRWLGYVGALSRLYAIRGFKISDLIDWIIYDEFIPEKHVRRMSGEGDALLNIYTTVSGNRELQNMPPLKMALLANANNLKSDVLQKLKVADQIKKMSDKGQELYINYDRGLAIILPKATKIIEQRKKGALARLIGEDSEFYQMAYNNKFAYDSDLYVMAVDPNSVKPYMSIGNLYIYEQKNGPNFYISEKQRGAFSPDTIYPGGAEGVNASLIMNYPIQAAYNNGGVAFETISAKNHFLDLFNIKI